MRRATLIVALLVAAVAGAKKPSESGQFLDKSVITFPSATGEYTLGEIHYDPEQWVYGITSKWTVNGVPDGLRLTVFVYPIGRTGEEQAVAQQIADVEHSLHQAVGQGIYADLVVGEREPFVVVAPAPSVLKQDEKKNRSQRKKKKDLQDDEPPALMPKPERAIEAEDDTDPLAAMVAASRPSPNSHGLRQSFHFTHDGVPVRSLGYVFYRHLFAFKVRITAPADSMDDATFTALADTATRTLVPRIDVMNFGQFGNIMISEPAADIDEEAASNAFAEQMILGIARIRTDNCASSDRESSADESRGGKQVEIVYPPDTWKASD